MKKYIPFVFCLCALSCLADGNHQYLSLKKDEVNWRRGPGDRFPIEWVYQEKGYPVLMLDKYDHWYQVQESDGSIGWVHQTMLSNKRTALVQEEGNLTNKPTIDSQVVAVAQPGTIGKIERCPKEYQFCLLSFKNKGTTIKGWFPRSYLWGIDINEDID